MTPSTQILTATRRPTDDARFVRIERQQRRSSMEDAVAANRRSTSEAVQPVDGAELVRLAPDAHWELRRGARLVGRCSLWWTGTPELRGLRVGFIGHFAAEDGQVAAVLRQAGTQLSAHGCELAVGPVDGSTWHDYRFVTQTGGQPPFLLEPTNPPEWPHEFKQAGFEPLAHYFSALCSRLDGEDPRVTRAKTRLTAAAVRIRPIQLHDFEAELLRIYSVARAAFCGNPLYTEPTPAEFVAECRALAALVPYELVLLAEHDGRAVGFVFAVPDLLQRQRGERIDTIVVKTLAALPERRFAGLGQWLLTEVQQRAHELGFRRAIHALVRDAGHLRRISGRSAVPIREYTLFGKALQP